MPDSVTQSENDLALERYQESVESARRYADEDRASAMARYDDSIDSARYYANRSNADSTWKAYASDWKAFESWCQSVSAVALPACPETVCGFLAIEAKDGRALSTLRRRLSAIRLMHIARDLPSPHEAHTVALVLKGIANEQKHRTLRKAKPALDTDVKRMIDAMDSTTAQGIRDRALLLVGFDGAFRRSELVMITIEMIEVRPPEGLLIHLPYSKTDQQGTGHTIPILSRPGSAYCPVSALQLWLDASECTEGVIFKRLHKGDKVGKTGLSAQSVSLIVKASVKRAGFTAKEIKQYSGHSLRRGVMTDTARTGASVPDIMQLGRHKKADTAMGYVDRESALKKHPTRTLLR